MQNQIVISMNYARKPILDEIIIDGERFVTANTFVKMIIGSIKKTDKEVEAEPYSTLGLRWIAGE